MDSSSIPHPQPPVKTPVKIPVKAPVKTPAKVSPSVSQQSRAPASEKLNSGESFAGNGNQKETNLTIRLQNCVNSVSTTPAPSGNMMITKSNRCGRKKTVLVDSSDSSTSDSSSDDAVSDVPSSRCLSSSTASEVCSRSKGNSIKRNEKMKYSTILQEESGDEDEKMSLLQLAKKKKLMEQLATAQELEAQVEPKAKFIPKRPPKNNFPTDLDSKLEKVNAVIAKVRADIRMKESGKEVSLSTSKVNYIDPRVVCAWCKRNDVPCTKVYSKTVLNKFPWAVGVDLDFIF